MDFEGLVDHARHIAHVDILFFGNHIKLATTEILVTPGNALHPVLELVWRAVKRIILRQLLITRDDGDGSTVAACDVQWRCDCWR